MKQTKSLPYPTSENTISLVLSHKWFDAIESGEKQYEYRLCSKRNESLIRKKTKLFDMGKTIYLKFFRAYAKERKEMLFLLDGHCVKNGLHTDLAIDKDVFELKIKSINH